MNYAGSQIVNFAWRANGFRRGAKVVGSDAAFCLRRRKI